MRHALILVTLILLLGIGKALTEDHPSDVDNSARPHAIDVTAPPTEAAAEPPQEESPPEDSEQSVGAVEPPPEGSAQVLDAAELDQLVAPIALYPDALLAQIFIASTYPLEVVEADRFVKANPNLKGDALKAELAKEDWDDSVKALVEAPELLAMMSAELDWMQNLGDAVLAQQPDVMEAVQRLRARAEASGKLESTEQQNVVVSEDAGRREIVIVPAQPEVVYVPYYEPSDVYGPWPYPSHPPYAFAPPPPRYAPPGYGPPRGYSPGAAIATGAIAFGAGYLLGRALDDDIDWRDRHIRVHRKPNHYNRNAYGPRREISKSNWKHNAQHRRGVKYKNADVWKKYAKGNKPRAKSAAAARSKPNARYYRDLQGGVVPKAKSGDQRKYESAYRKAGPSKSGKPHKPSKQLSSKQPSADASAGPKKPNAKFKPSKPTAKAVNGKPGSHGKAVKPQGPPKVAKAKPDGPPKIAKAKSEGPPKAAKAKPEGPPKVAKPKRQGPPKVAKPKPQGAPKVAKAKGPPKTAKAKKGPGKPSKAANASKRKPPSVAKGKGGGKGENAAAKARAKVKEAAKNGKKNKG